jgi:hypothetical protein
MCLQAGIVRKSILLWAHGDSADNEPRKPARLGSEILTDLGTCNRPQVKSSDTDRSAMGRV